MICNNCGQTFPTNRINVEKGGCNPAPLKRTVANGQLIINVEDIYSGIRYFASGYSGVNEPFLAQEEL